MSCLVLSCLAVVWSSLLVLPHCGLTAALSLPHVDPFSSNHIRKVREIKSQFLFSSSGGGWFFMTALKPTVFSGEVTWLGIVQRSNHEEGRDSIRSVSVTTLELTLAGSKGEFHSGEVRWSSVSP